LGHTAKAVPDCGLFGDTPGPFATAQSSLKHRSKV
jgi:hypothetical protein